MEDALTFLQSRPLIGIQMDGSHLNSVLQAILRQQSECVQLIAKLERRFDHVEESVREVQLRQGELNRTVNEHIGSGQEVRKLQSQMDEIEGAIDNIYKEVENNKKHIVNAATDADQAGELADSAMRSASGCQETLRKLSADVESVLRQGHSEKKELTRLMEEMHRMREADESKLNEVIRRVEERADQLSLRARSVDELRTLLDELSDRTDDNFRSVEESARAVDAELTRQTTELSSLRADLNALETSTRNRLSSVTTHTDAKIDAVASQFRDYERTARELEEHLIMAGQVLARRQTSTTLDTNANKKFMSQSKNRNNEYDNNNNDNNDEDNNYTNSIARITHQTPRSQVTSVPSATRISTEHKIMNSATNPNRRRSSSSNNSNERNYMYSDNRNQSGSINNADNRKGIERDSLLANGSAVKSRSRNI